MDFFTRTAVQKSLNELLPTPPNLTIDGQWGPMTITALRSFQGLNGLSLSGQYDANTQAVLSPFMAAKYLSIAAINAAANQLAVDVPAMVTVALTESKSAGFLASGDPVILFERHKMYAALTAKLGPTQTQQYARLYPNIVNLAEGGYQGGQAEYRRLNLALALDRDSALASASWGMFQIMGFNFPSCGYPSVLSYVTDQRQSELQHLQSFVKFILANSILVTALRTHNWTAFAQYYNGSGAIAAYSSKLASNFDQATSYLA
jgi:hypothetical protein